MSALINSIEQLVSLPKLVKKDLLANIERHHFSKRSLLVKSGSYCNQLYFIEKGMVRTFYHLPDKEITSWLYSSGQFVSCWDSFLKQQASEENLEALTKVTVEAMPYNKLQMLFDKHPCLERWGRKLMESYTLYFNAFNQQIRFATAKEKYTYFLQTFRYKQKIKLGHIASFLGMTQETLSRLRKEATINS